MTLFVCRCKPLCNFSGPQTVHKSLLGSKSEELIESFKFIQFVVGTGIDKVLYKMLMYSHTISSRVRKDMWLKGRKKKQMQDSLLLAILSLTFVKLST